MPLIYAELGEIQGIKELYCDIGIKKEQQTIKFKINNKIICIKTIQCFLPLTEKQLSENFG
jgi:hypothetical protein